eukprot:2882845-Pleurochrysis_carterae.AAC.5
MEWLASTPYGREFAIGTGGLAWQGQSCPRFTEARELWCVRFQRVRRVKGKPSQVPPRQIMALAMLNPGACARQPEGGLLSLLLRLR